MFPIGEVDGWHVGRWRYSLLGLHSAVQADLFIVWPLSFELYAFWQLPYFAVTLQFIRQICLLFGLTA